MDWRRLLGKKDQNLSSTRPEPEHSSNEPIDEPPQMTAEDLLIESVQRFRNDVQKVHARMQAEHRVAISNAQTKISAAESLIKRTGLDRALLVLLKETWHWASWSQRDDVKKWQNLDATEVSGDSEKTDDGTISRVFFSFASQTYRLEFLDSGRYFESTKFGHISLHIADEKVITLRVSHNLERGLEYDEWEPAGVEFFAPGQWITSVVEMQTSVELAQQRRYLDMQREYLDKQARGLPK